MNELETDKFFKGLVAGFFDLVEAEEVTCRKGATPEVMIAHILEKALNATHGSLHKGALKNLIEMKLNK